MDSISKPHAICIPYPAQGHINPMLMLAKLLHSKNFHITFVNTHYNRNRLLRSRGKDAVDGLPDFRFESISDGLPPSDADSTQSTPALCYSKTRHCPAQIRNLLLKLKDESSGGLVPPVSCIVYDGAMSFTLEIAEEFGLPEVLFWTTSECGLLLYSHYKTLIQRGFVPLKDMSYLTNGYMETIIDEIPRTKDIRLRDFPSFIRTTDIDDIMLNVLITESGHVAKSSALILNTFDALDQDVLDALSALNPHIYTVGPLHLALDDQAKDENLQSIGSNLWKEDAGCIEWLNSKEPNSVVYVNFGSITVMSAQQLTEFAWGLANSKKHFLWITRPDIVAGDLAMLPPEFIIETKDRGKLASWCEQKEVMKHPSIGGFLTHNGWNSTIESISFGVPMICWPFFAEQLTNCRYCCTEWGIGLEIDNNVKRDEVEMFVKKLMDAEIGAKMKNKVVEWKMKAEEAIGVRGSSAKNVDRLISEVLFAKLIN